MTDPATSHAPALALREAGRYREAADLLARQPDDAEAQAHLSQVLLLDGQVEAAEAALARAQALSPALPPVLRAQARLMLRRQQPAEALAAAQAALAAAPGDPENLLLLAAVHLVAGRDAAAAPLLDQALALRPAYPEALANRGQLRLRQGDRAAALADFEAAQALKPFMAFWGMVANLRYQAGDLAGAITALESALAQDPANVSHLVNLGEFKRQAGALDAAIALLRQATDLAPGVPDAWANLGAALQQAGRTAEAKAAYGQAIAIRPALAEVYLNLGRLHAEDLRLADAEACYRQAIAIRPDLAEAYFSLGGVLKDQGRLDEAAGPYARALALRPTLDNALHAHLIAPVIAASNAEIETSRARFEAGIAALAASPRPFANPPENLPSPWFYLAYQNRDDRPAMAALAQAFTAVVPGLTFTAPHVAGWTPPTNRRIRVGFLSDFFYGHTVGKLYRGFIQHLDRTRFEVVVLHGAGSKRDAFRDQVDALADRAVVLPTGLGRQQLAVAAEGLDVLLTPDIGMSTATYFLAFSRLAPVQAVTWGHPNTTGLPAMDYFLSAEGVETPEADAYYTERLVRFARLPIYYDPVVPPAQVLSRADLLLPPDGVLYGCPQSLFKFHPDFDAVLAEIALGDPTGWIVVVDGRNAVWTERLKARWGASHPILLERVRILPRLSQATFLSLLAHIDVLLDPLYFGSGNTLYEAMAFGTPVVTAPGRFIRGRLVEGVYRQMGIKDAPVATRTQDYAPLALALGRDPERRAALRRACLAAAPGGFYADIGAVRELEAFLEAAAAAAGRGERLPVGWRAA